MSIPGFHNNPDQTRSGKPGFGEIPVPMLEESIAWACAKPLNQTLPTAVSAFGVIKKTMLATLSALRTRFCRLSPYGLLVLTMLFWSGNMVVGRGIRHDIPPLALAFWRWAIALLLLLPLALPHWRTQWPLLKQHCRVILLLGLLGVASYNTLAYIALQYTVATNAVLLNAFIPMATMALSWLFLKKTLRLQEGCGVILSLIGVITIVLQGNPAHLHTLDFNRGDLWMLLAVLVWAIYTIGLRWSPPALDPTLLLASLVSVGVLALAPAYAWEIHHGRTIVLNPASIASLLYVGIFPSFLGYIFYNRAVAEIGANRASLFIHLMPVFGTLLSVVFLSETPFWYHYLGIGLIFAGIALGNRQRRHNHAKY